MRILAVAAVAGEWARFFMMGTSKYFLWFSR